MKPRALRQREPISVAPQFVTQLTCLEVLGVDSRRYLEHVVTLPACVGFVVKVGKLRALPLRIAISALEGLALQDVADTEGEVAHGDQPQTPDDVLRLVGMKRTG